VFWITPDTPSLPLGRHRQRAHLTAFPSPHLAFSRLGNKGGEVQFVKGEVVPEPSER